MSPYMTGVFIIFYLSFQINSYAGVFLFFSFELGSGPETC